MFSPTVCNEVLVVVTLLLWVCVASSVVVFAVVMVRS